MDYKKTAHEILAASGGKENLVSAAHCATRLRLVIADNTKIQKSVLEGIDGVKGVFEASGQLQIIIGTGTVNKVFAEFIAEAGIEASTKEEIKQTAAAKAPWYKRAVKTLGDIFVPIIPAIVATGLLNGLLGGLVQVFPELSGSQVYGLLNLFSNTALTFLPILIAVSAAKIFGGNLFLGAVVGMIMIHPDLVNAWSAAGGADTQILWSWFGVWNISNVGYQGHVIPVILSVWLMSSIEKQLHKKVPELFDLFVTPLCSVLIAGFFSLTLIGPVFAQLESWVLCGAQALLAIPFGIGSFLMGAVYAPTVVAGVHHMYNAIEMMMLADSGINTWMPLATAANVGQGAAALAVALKTKNTKTKALALPASLSAFMGITEPAIFGVNIRFMRPFIAGMIGGGCGAAAASILNVYATANGVTGLFGFLITTDCFFGYLLTLVISFAVSFAASWILWKSTEEADKAADPHLNPSDTEAANADIPIVSPLIGSVIALENVPDPTFASGMIGPGIAVEPSEGKVIAPENGTVSMLFDTHHAIGLELDSGAQLLIHVGINTVELNGEGFTACVAQGDRIQKGQTLLTFDKSFIKNKGYETVTPVILTNADEFSSIEYCTKEFVTASDLLIKCSNAKSTEKETSTNDK